MNEITSDKIIVGQDIAPKSPVVSVVESVPMPVQMRTPSPAMPMDVDDDIINEKQTYVFSYYGNPKLFEFP